MDRVAVDRQRLIEELHASRTRAVIVVAGAGSQAISWVLSVAGASNTVLEAQVVYAPTSLADFLGHEPEQYVSPDTAREIARRAYLRAIRLRSEEDPVVGVACTATIATNRPKRGEHRCHVAAWSASAVETYSLVLDKGGRDRSAEEAIVSDLVLRALAEASRVDFDLEMGLSDRESVVIDSRRFDDPIKALMAKHVSTVTLHPGGHPDGHAVADRPVRGGVLPGSFNPLHEGHRRLASAASRLLGDEITFELSIANVDKPPLEEREVRRRADQFVDDGPLVVSHAPVFQQKARLFPGCTFVVGWDTTVRLFDPRYYGGEELAMLKALDEIRSLGCRFLVAGRVDEGVFRTLDEVSMPRGFDDMLAPIPESVFRYDVTSTDLRLADGRP